MSKYEAIVVGSGPNGLAAAIVLAASGRSVLVLEASERIGGGARSAELTLPGFVHDICSAVHPMALASPFFRTLPLEKHGLQWIDPEYALAHPFEDGDEDGFGLTLGLGLGLGAGHDGIGSGMGLDEKTGLGEGSRLPVGLGLESKVGDGNPTGEGSDPPLADGLGSEDVLGLGDGSTELLGLGVGIRVTEGDGMMRGSKVLVPEISPKEYGESTMKIASQDFKWSPQRYPLSEYRKRMP